METDILVAQDPYSRATSDSSSNLKRPNSMLYTDRIAHTASHLAVMASRDRASSDCNPPEPDLRFYTSAPPSSLSPCIMTVAQNLLHKIVVLTTLCRQKSLPAPFLILVVI